MEIREYDRATDQARAIRTAVFVVEKDYRPEFDEWDEPGRATHLLAFEGGRAIATCRFFPDPEHTDQLGRWVIARLAVAAGERGRGVGKMMLSEAERRILAAGGRIAAVHSEDKNFAMYEHFGYQATDEFFDNGTHGWMVKALKTAD
ncbi:GNAT family N-acetyltransferase [Bifidobacterium sp. UBA744]|uniref:GNAT family N-acetyltransferase n=1 Tax=Bifidobacterium sp. UBA744 TaxID=1946112 RepID=UPI0025BF57EC|nr:GNAT family N-acetyltransferase [Bifidobacterium sp. UBA744]